MTGRRTTKLARAGSALGVALVLAGGMAAPLAAQEVSGEDLRWLPWQGCWEPVGGPASGGLLCVRPADGGVEMLSVRDGEVTGRDVMIADGEVYDFEREGCRGRQSARFSTDEGRIFTNAIEACEGDFSRSVNGIMAMTSPTRWIDVQIDTEDPDVSWVSEYRLASIDRVREAGFGGIVEGRELAVRVARHEASTSTDIEDVREAVTRVPARGVETWLAEQGVSFDLSSDQLVALADGGVPSDVIDVMIAVSFPERFALANQATEQRSGGGYVGAGAAREPYYGYGDPFFYDPYYVGFSRFDRFRLSGTRHFGFFRPTIVVINRAGGAVGSTGGGRAVKGRGYTRGGLRNPSLGRTGVSSGTGSAASSSGRASTGRRAKPRGSGGSGSGGGGGGGGGSSGGGA